MKVNMDDYRQPSAYEGIYKYIAPDGYKWMCKGDDFGKIIWGGYDLSAYNYILAKIENYEENMDNTNINNNNTNDGKCK